MCRSLGSVADAVWLRRQAALDLGLIQDLRIYQQDVRIDADPADVAPANFLDWHEQATAFEVVADVQPYSFDYTEGPEPVTLMGAAVSRGFFRAMGVQPLIGRTFRDAEHEAGRDKVVLLSYGCWQRRFGGDVSLVGRAVRLDEEPHIVIGVLPPELQPGLLQGRREREVWAPLVIRPWMAQRRGSASWNVVARLRADVSLDAAQEEMRSISARLAQDHPRTNGSMVATVVPLRDHLVGPLKPALLVLLGAVGLVLLLACAAVANILLTRGAERHRELAVRMALGARRGRLIRQLLVECLLLAMLGGAVGIAVAHVSMQVIVALAPGDIPRMSEIGLDGRILAFAIALAGGTGLLFGLAPAVKLSQPQMNDIKQATGGLAAGMPRRLRSTLVVAQIAIALLLLVGAGLLVRSFTKLLAVDPGFTTANILAVQVFSSGGRYKTPEQLSAFYTQAIDGMRALPGVSDVGLVSAMPRNARRLTSNPSRSGSGRSIPHFRPMRRSHWSSSSRSGWRHDASAFCCSDPSRSWR